MFPLIECNLKTAQMRSSTCCRDQAGMLRSSELVMKLNGSDAEQAADTDGAYELVFGRSMGAMLAAALRCLPHSAALMHPY